MNPETVALLSMIGTLISAVAAAAAAIVSLSVVGSWKKEVTYESRRNALIAWMSNAALFQGALKQVYLQKVKWPEDKETIEFVSKQFFALVSTWPAVQSSLSGASRQNAEEVWTHVFVHYNAYMDGSGTLTTLSESVAAIYNSEQIQKLVQEVG